MRKCPRCALINPDSSQRCDCGFDFRFGRADLERSRSMKAHGSTMWLGVLLLIIGVGLSGFFYLGAERGGGGYRIFIGLIIVGMILIVNGWSRRRDLKP